MQRIDHPTADPNANGPGKAGFNGGDPVAMVPATVLTPEWANVVQEELANAVAQYEPLDPARNNQLAGILATMGPSAALLPLNNVWTGINTFAAAVRAQQLGIVAGELLYIDATGAPTPRETWRSINLARGTGNGVYETITGRVAINGLPVAAHTFELDIPHGAGIIGYLAAVTCNDTVDIIVEARLSKVAKDLLAATSTYSVIHSTTMTIAVGMAGLVGSALIPTPEAADNGGFVYNIDLIVQGKALIQAVSRGYRDPGPRNG